MLLALFSMIMLFSIISVPAGRYIRQLGFPVVSVLKYSVTPVKSMLVMILFSVSSELRPSTSGVDPDIEIMDAFFKISALAGSITFPFAVIVSKVTILDITFQTAFSLYLL